MESEQTTPSNYQFVPAHIEVCQGKHGLEVVIVLYSTIASLGETKLPFDNPEGMLHFGSDVGLSLGRPKTPISAHFS